MREFFNQVAGALTHALGTPAALFIAIGVIVAWLLTGPAFGFSDTWQLLINTGTTIVTFLMVFVIQNAQNRDSKAVHAKLDELLRAQQGAREEFVIAEVEPEEQLDRQIAELRALAANSPHLKPLLATRLREFPIEPGGEDDPDARAADEPARR